MQEIEFSPRPTDPFAEVLSPAEREQLDAALARVLAALGERTIWHVNSTAAGGGVAELLHSLLPYQVHAGVRARWLVVEGDAPLFDITKRVHNRLHDNEGDGGPLGDGERDVYDRALAGQAGEAVQFVRPGDVAVLHDPQTAGLVPVLRRHGACVIWRCHVGVDTPGPRTREAWAFLARDVRDADALVFSRPNFVWEGLDRSKIEIIPPCIDVLAPKNRPLDDATVAAMAWLDRAGMIEDVPLDRDAPLVVQVSRWDGLKDPVGVLHGFAAAPASVARAHLVLAGPSNEAVKDDPEGAETLALVEAARAALDADVRRRTHLACLPMDDADENALMVNAIQRRADIVVQKSLAEGFGLTVSEAMWKSRPVVASRVGGIQDQIVDGESGLLVDARDLDAFGAALATVLDDRALAERLGTAAHERVRGHYLPTHHFEREATLLERLLPSQ